MLAWERAPALPIGQWFTSGVAIAAAGGALSDGELHELLWDAIRKLFSQRIVLDFTDHLSDRALYCLIYRDILPSPEKKIDAPRNFLHWDCSERRERPGSVAALLRDRRRPGELRRGMPRSAAAALRAAVPAEDAACAVLVAIDAQVVPTRPSRRLKRRNRFVREDGLDERFIATDFLGRARLIMSRGAMGVALGRTMPMPGFEVFKRPVGRR